MQAPSEIEGEPRDVVAQIQSDLVGLGSMLGPYIADVYTQLRAAGLDEHGSVAAWEDSPEGEAAGELRQRATNLIVSLRRVVER